MGSSVECFVLHPIPRGLESLRRFVYTTKNGACSKSGYGCHDATVAIGEVEMDTPEEGKYEQYIQPDSISHDDSRWPKTCVCDYEFTDKDEWQINHDRFYARDDGTGVTTWHAAPSGAMRIAWWMGECFRGPDGKTWAVKLPDGSDWIIDGPANNGRKDGPAWTRTGTAPLFTANPSIKSPNYHGFLRNGRLEEC